MNCAFCPHHKCYTEGQNCTKYSHEEVCGFYSEDDRRMMRASSATESRNYMKMTRLEESAFFAQGNLAAADNGAAFAVKVEHCRIAEQIFFHIISLPCCDFCLKNYIKIQLQ